MQQMRYHQQISAAEWRWVLICAVALVLLAMLPFALMPLMLNGEARSFMGVVHDPENAASALASVRLGAQNEWLWRSLHTPETQRGIISDVPYILLGQVARLARLDTLALFHVARALAALFMFHAIYLLGAAIWSRVNSRRIFWFVASVGAGFGWIIAPLLGQATPDIQSALMFPFHAALANVHLPLTIGCLSFLAAAMLDSLRPGAQALPNITNSGLTLIVFSLALALIYPSAFGPLSIAYAVALMVDARARGLASRNLQWFGWFIIPALPLLVYNGAVVVNDPLVMALWALEARVDVPPLHLLLIALGLPLILALPGIWRALRRFEPDGSAFMLVWLVAMLALGYGMPVVRGKFLLGMMIPVAYFATRAAGDFWFPAIANPRWRYRIAAAIVPLLVASNAVALIAPLASTLPRLTLPSDYSAAFNYLRGRSGSAVILTSGETGVWLPAWTGRQVVYASPNLTLDAAEKSAAVARWFAETDPAACESLLRGRPSHAGRYTVRYVVYGPHERALGHGACLDGLVEMARFGSVTVYLTLN